MRNLVVYSSKTGNTRKLAEAIYEYLPAEKEIYPINEAPDPEDYTFVAVGFRIENGKPDKATQEYLKKFIDEKELFIFATHASKPESEMVKTAMNKAKELAKRARIVGVFDCQGEVPEEVLEEARKQQPVPEWVKDAEKAKGHPNKQDKDRLIRLLNSLDLPL